MPFLHAGPAPRGVPPQRWALRQLLRRWALPRSPSQSLSTLCPSAQSSRWPPDHAPAAPPLTEPPTQPLTTGCARDLCEAACTPLHGRSPPQLRAL